MRGKEILTIVLVGAVEGERGRRKGWKRLKLIDNIKRGYKRIKKEGLGQEQLEIRVTNGTR